MESTTLLVLSYLFKVFVFTKPSLAADEVAVLDIVGEELKADTEYYILPVLRGGDMVTNWFKIEKPDGDYKLVFCPKVCDCGLLCRKIGIYMEDNGVGTLSLSDALQPFKVQLKKVLKTTS